MTLNVIFSGFSIKFASFFFYLKNELEITLRFDYMYIFWTRVLFHCFLSKPCAPAITESEPREQVWYRIFIGRLLNSVVRCRQDMMPNFGGTLTPVSQGTPCRCYSACLMRSWASENCGKYCERKTIWAQLGSEGHNWSMYLLYAPHRDTLRTSHLDRHRCNTKESATRARFPATRRAPISRYLSRVFWLYDSVVSHCVILCNNNCVVFKPPIP